MSSHWPTAFDVKAWELQLDLGFEPTENDGHVSTVYSGTFARVLAATLAACPQLRDPRTMTRLREMERRRVFAHLGL